MFDEAQQYAPVVEREDGSLAVTLGADHPGFADPVYRRRRDDLAALARAWQPGEPLPDAPYTEDEHAVWAQVCSALRDAHRVLASEEYLLGKERLGLPEDRVPQLQEVSDLLEPLTGFRYLPAAGLVPLRDFYGSLADKRFHSTQYVRHHSVPLYTPEPDVLHEVLGHGGTLASDRLAALYETAGQAVRRVQGDAALQVVSKVFWFTLEFGVVHESDGLKAYGAGILSSPGELAAFRGMQVRPLDLSAMASLDYDITSYQDVLFAADSISQLEDVVGGFWARCATQGDDAALALVG